MMIILAAQDVNMQRQRRGSGKAAQAVRQHLGAQVADALPPQPQLHHRAPPVRQIHHCSRERFVQRREGVPEPGEAGG